MLFRKGNFSLKSVKFLITESESPIEVTTEIEPAKFFKPGLITIDEPMSGAGLNTAKSFYYIELTHKRNISIKDSMIRHNTA